MNPPLLTDPELLDTIATLSTPAYHNLSRFHTEYLEELKLEAKRRHLPIHETTQP